MNVFETIAHQLHIEWFFVSALFAAGLLILAALSVRRAVSDEHSGVMPDEGITIRNVVEVIIEALGDLGETTIGPEWRRYFPIVGTIFFFVLISNLLSLIPGMLGATSDRNVTFAWAIISFLVYNYVGIKQHKWKYIYQFMGPALWVPEIGGKSYHVRILAPFFLPLELVLHGARILTLQDRSIGSGIGLGHQDRVAASFKRDDDLGDLLRRLAHAQYHFWKARAQRTVMIKLGETQVLVGKISQQLHRLIDVHLVVLDVLQQGS